MAGATPDRNCVSGAKDIGRACGLAARLQGLMAYDGVRIALGALLLTAAALKGHQLATEPVAETGLLTSRWFLIGVVEFELFFGLWLLAGLYPRRTWQVALLCFGGFAAVSLYKALSGEASCGCFGKVPVNPWYTLLLDMAAVTALLWCRPNPAPSRVFERDCRRLLRPAEVAMACLALGIPAAVAMGTYQAATISEAGRIYGDNEFVILEPEKWIGQRFALLNYIDIGERLAEGRWIVVMYDHDCPNCQESILEYERWAQHSERRIGNRQVALIEMPPYGRVRDAVISPDSSCVLGRLSDTRRWFAETPIEVVLVQGVASRVTKGGDRTVRGSAGGLLATEDVL